MYSNTDVAMFAFCAAQAARPPVLRVGSLFALGTQRPCCGDAVKTIHIPRLELRHRQFSTSSTYPEDIAAIMKHTIVSSSFYRRSAVVVAGIVGFSLVDPARAQGVSVQDFDWDSVRPSSHVLQFYTLTTYPLFTDHSFGAIAMDDVLYHFSMLKIFRQSIYTI